MAEAARNTPTEDNTAMNSAFVKRGSLPGLG